MRYDSKKLSCDSSRPFIVLALRGIQVVPSVEGCVDRESAKPSMAASMVLVPLTRLLGRHRIERDAFAVACPCVCRILQQRGCGDGLSCC